MSACFIEGVSLVVITTLYERRKIMSQDACIV
jgi:hypothetical protein